MRREIIGKQIHEEDARAKKAEGRDRWCPCLSDPLHNSAHQNWYYHPCKEHDAIIYEGNQNLIYDEIFDLHVAAKRRLRNNTLLLGKYRRG